ncbi:MAG: SPFH domain-containing protein [Gammaproteobacteria bacterium]
MEAFGGVGFIAGGIAGVVAFIILVVTLKTLVRVCAPDQILVVTGTKTQVDGREYGFRIQDGGWTFVIPYLQSVQALDLNIIPINVRVEGVNSANGITVGADATACVCVDDAEPTMLYAAVERLMGKSRDEIQEQIQHTMVGNFRGALNKTTPLQAIGMEDVGDSDQDHHGDGERAQFRSALLADSTQDLSTFGMRVVSVSMQRIWDTSNYIANLANKTLARKRQEVEIEEARLHAQADQAESDADRLEAVAKNEADQNIIAASQELEVTRRQCEATIQRTKLETDAAIAKASSEGERQVQEAMAKLQELRNQSMITLEAEAKLDAAKVLAQGEGEAVEIVRRAHNDLLKQKVELVSQAGDNGKVVLFVQQRLAQLFEVYQEHAKNIGIDSVVVMDDERGIKGVVNRGPESFVDFLNQLEDGFGISVKDLLSVPEAQPSKSVEAAQ